MKTALLFPGQGAQFIGMGQEIIKHNEVAANIFNKLPQQLRELICEGSIEELSDTRYTQPAIFGVSMAILAAVDQTKLNISGAAGLSLGEYSALCAAGAISFEQGLTLVTQRAKLMHESVPDIATAMLAVIGQEATQLEQIISDFMTQYPNCKIIIANYNTDKQQVVAGTTDAIDFFKSYLRQQRIKSVVLKVSGPFHTSLLSQASHQFLGYLEQINFETLNYPVYSNVTAHAYTARTNFSEQLANQISYPVYFYQMIQKMIDDGYQRFIEIGPGTILSKFVKQISPNTAVITINNLEDLKQLIEGDITC